MTNIYKIVSAIFEPKLTFLLFLTYLSLKEFNSFYLFLFTISYVFISLILLFSIERKITTNDYKFSDNFARKSRYMIYLLTSIICLAYLLYSILSSNIEFSLIFVLILIFTAVLLFIAKNLHHKISAHIFYNGIILILLPPTIYKYFIFIILFIIVGISRIGLKKHNLTQIVIAGMLVYIFYTLTDTILYVLE